MRHLTSVLIVLMLSLAPAVSASAQQFTQFHIQTNHLVYDPVSAKLYASVPGTAGDNGNSIAVIDPVSAAVERYVPVGSEPSALAVSDDGQYLYVGLDGEHSVVRVHLPDMTVGQKFGLGTSSYGSSYLARHITVMPGNSETVAIIRATTSAGDGSLAVFDSGALRPNTGTESLRSSAFASNGATLFGVQRGSSSLTFKCYLYRYDLTVSGVSAPVEVGDYISGCGADIVRSGSFLLGGGRVMDIEAQVPVARLPDTSRLLVPDLPNGRVYVPSASVGYNGLLFSAYSSSTWRPLWSVAKPEWLTSQSYLDDFVSCAQAVAFRYAGSVFVVSLDDVFPLTIDKAGTGDGTIRSNPTGILCASDRRACGVLFPAAWQVTLSATPIPGSQFVKWTGDADCSDGVVTMWAARNCTAVFAQTAPRAIVSIPVVANDLVYVPALDRLVATVSGSDPAKGNSIVLINPSTGALGPAVWVGSEPGKLALSEDETALYVGLDGTGTVRRIDLPSLVPGEPFRLGTQPFSPHGVYFAQHLAVLPGSNSSLAVVRDIFSGASGSVAVYDNGVARSAATPERIAYRIAASDTPTRVYAAIGSYFSPLAVDAHGVSVVSTTQDSESGGWITFSGGRVYSSERSVIEPETFTRVGTLPRSTGVTADAARGVVHLLLCDPHPCTALQTFGMQDFALRQSIRLPSHHQNTSYYPHGLILAGPHRLAYLPREGREVAVAYIDPNSVHHDIDGDGSPDILWHDRLTGTLLVWSMNGSARVNTAQILGSMDPDWRVAARADFNRDGRPDLLWRHAVTGDNHIWYMDGTAFLASVPTTSVPDPNWRVVGAADFNGDGKPDILWQNLATGQSVLWYMNGASRTSYAAVKPASPPWQMVGAGDFNADGKPDIVLRNPLTGENGIWYMNGDAFLRAQLIAPAAPGWTLADVADFDLDGQADLLWRNTGTGENILWSMNGAARARWEALPPQTANWDVLAGPPGRGASGGQGTDFNGDGKPDLLWRNATTGEHILWYMDGATFTGYERLQTVSDTSWRAVATADFNADGQTDILWRSTVSGENLVWLMSGSTFLRSESFTRVADVDWEIAATADIDKDGWTDLVWRHRTTGEVILWYMTGTACRSYTRLRTVADPAWRIVGAADFTRDAYTDLLWRNATTGENVVWEMDYAGGRVAPHRLRTVGDTSWHPTSLADFNQDGKTDIVWRNTTTGENIVWFMNGTVYTGYHRLRAVTDPAWAIVPDRQ